MPRDAELSRHDPDVPDWDSLPADARRLAARMMEVYAGFLSHTDHHIGRLLDFLKETGEFDNTLIMVVSDNGASAEGGPAGTTNELQFFNNAPESLEESLAKIDELGGPGTFDHYPWGWTWAGNTPFRRWKRETYRGGTSDPFLVHWPAGISARGEVRTQYAHIIDMVPTVLDALGLQPPATIRGVTQSPLHGVSFAHTFDDPAAPTRHRTQYFEMFGHRAIDHDGWRAVCPWPGPSFAEAGQAVRRADQRPQTLTDLDAQPLGAVPRRQRPGREPRPGRPAPGQAHRADRDVVHRGRQVQRVPDRRQRDAAADDRAPAGGRAADPVRLPARHPDAAVLGRPAGAQPAACHHRRRRDPGRRRRGRAAVPGQQRRRLVVLRQGQQAALRPQLRRPRDLPGVAHRTRCPRAGTSCGSSSSPPASPTSPRARAPRAGRSCTSTASSPPRTSSRSPRPSRSTPAGSPAAPTPARRSPRTTRPRSRFTGTLHTVTVDLSGDLITDTEAEMRMAMARQ